MKKVFRSHIILLLEGRLFCFIMLFCLALFGYAIVQCFREKEILSFIMFLFLEIVAVLIFYATFWRFFWPLIWGKLIIDDTGVKWKCLFKKSIFLSWNECKYVGFETFTEGNVIKVDFYNTGFRYIYFSTTPYPKEFSGKINKLNCKEGFIKFFSVNEKICSAVLEHIDVPALKTFTEEQQRIKRREDRLRKKKSERKKNKKSNLK